MSEWRSGDATSDCPRPSDHHALAFCDQGTIPECITKLEKLEQLYIYDNRLSGEQQQQQEHISSDCARPSDQQHSHR